MQWVAFYVKRDAYLPRAPGEKVRLTVLATNIEAYTHQLAELAALEVAWYELKGWVLIGVMKYDPRVHDNLGAYEEVVGGVNGRDSQEVDFRVVSD